MTLSIIIPVYNEKDTILEIIEKIKAVDLGETKKEIIIVDDGSTDGTRDVLRKQFPFSLFSSPSVTYKIIYHSKNQGKGSAIKTALEHVLGDYVIIQDADLEYDPRDYSELLNCAFKNNAEVVYGSRRLDPQNKPNSFSYYLGGIFLSLITNLLYGVHITDESTGYKLFKIKTIKSIVLKCERFEFCPEITAKIIKRGIKIYEVPIKYYYRTKKEGKKIKWRDGFYAIWILIKYKFIE
jgi:dolichol-phosphate mannosyltransferase